jgi:Ca2+-binding RTX toxin-like protein
MAMPTEAMAMTHSPFSCLVATQLCRGGAGQDQIGLTLLEQSGATRFSSILAGDGNDTITVDGLRQGQISGDAGEDSITLTTTMETDMEIIVQGGDAADVISIDGLVGDATVTGGTGNDQMTLTFEDAFVDANGGDGDDVVVLDFSQGPGVSNFSPSFLNGGSGNDALTLETFTGVAALDGGTGNDTLTASAFFGTFNGGAGDDTFDITIFAIQAGFFTVSGGDGQDSINLVDQVVQSVFAPRNIDVDPGAGNDVVFSGGTSPFTNVRYNCGENWGDDVMTGVDALRDVFIFTGVTGLDDVTDLTITGDASQTVISFADNSLTLVGLDVANASGLNMLFL